MAKANDGIKNPQLTGKRERIIQQLVERFKIDGSKILFLNANKPLEPWIPPTELKSIARRIGGFKRIAARYEQFIEATNQVVCVAELVDEDGVEYSNFGVATRDEANGLEAEIDAVVLASGRAMSATLNDAGFNPLKSNSVVANSEQPNKVEGMNVKDFASKSVKRNNDLKRIHVLADECGLIVQGDNGKDDTKYREWLFYRFPNFFNSAADASTSALTEKERKMVINKLVNYSEIEGVKQAA